MHSYSIPSIHVRQGGFELRFPAFSLNTHAVVGIFGKSGSGKTTLLQELYRKARTYGCIMLTQEDESFHNITVQQNLELGLLASSEHKYFDSIASTLQLGELMDRRPRDLSGGQRRRVAVGRVFAASAPILLLDEPFNGLGHIFEDRLIDLIADRRQCGYSTIVVSHDMNLLSSFADSIFVIEDGTLIGTLLPADLQWAPQSSQLCTALGVENVFSLQDLEKFAVIESSAAINHRDTIAFWKEWVEVGGEAAGADLIIKPRPETRISQHPYSTISGKFARLTWAGLEGGSLQIRASYHHDHLNPSEVPSWLSVRRLYCLAEE
jgi:ABC-type sulfate/molybdate transport systems ATPase subunit